MANINRGGYHQAHHTIKRFIGGANADPIVAINVGETVSSCAELMVGQPPTIIVDVHHLYIAGAAQSVEIDAKVKHASMAQIESRAVDGDWVGGAIKPVTGDDVVITKTFDDAEIAKEWRIAFINTNGSTYSSVFRVTRPVTMNLNEETEEVSENGEQ